MLTGLLFVIAAIAIGAILKLAAGIVQPFVIALLLSFVLNPLVEGLHRIRIPRIIGILLVLVLLLGAGSLLTYVAYSSVQRIVRVLPFYQDRVLELVRQGIEQFNLPDTLVQDLNLTSRVGSIILSFSGDFLSMLGSIVMVLVFLLFLLLEKPYLRPKVMEALEGRRTATIWQVVGHTNLQIGRYLQVKLVISTVTGGLVWLAFWIIGVDFAFIWALMSFLFNFIPSIGSIFISVAAIAFAFVQFYPEITPIIWSGISMLTIQLVLGNVIDPKLQGDSLKISPVVILVSLLFWGWLWGVVGLFLAVPLTVALKIIFEHIPGLEFLGVLMGRTALRESDEKKANTDETNTDG